MTILPSLDVFEKYNSNARDKVFSDVNNIFYNDNNDFLITSKYLDFLELNIEDDELIQLLIVELSDSGKICNNVVDNGDGNIFEKLYLDNCDRIDCLFAITIDEEPKINHYRYSKKNKQKKNREFIVFELLTKNIISLHHYDFKSNDEIQIFFKRLFDLPKNLSTISIYNRYSEYNYLNFLKNKSIHYFNLLKGRTTAKRLEFIRIESDLKHNLGRNLVLKSTDDSKLIHERKIFFNHFVLTLDQAFDNLLITELNWKFDIEVDRKKCFTEWAKKNRSFARLN